ncbi:hypothetical protein K7X08_024829 [Anisodus acutangulus]|uniref:Uncharacterized protein n=1 Tax=Anisodus acutangulus TaxID=402998 RepID=A0A9Q1RDA9_9SOLA|nr:hypothetical protein K7X08_024829 [Anisodus acutangulus]
MPSFSSITSVKFVTSSRKNSLPPLTNPPFFFTSSYLFALNSISNKIITGVVLSQRFILRSRNVRQIRHWLEEESASATKEMEKAKPKEIPKKDIPKEDKH